MILVDDRVGSRDLLTALVRAGVPAELMRMESGDFAFVGRGIAEEPITVGIELKRIRKGRGDYGRSDLIESLMSDRFAGQQLVGMQTFDQAWLVTEGLWRTSEHGNIEVYEDGSWVPLMQGRNFLMMKDIETRLMTLLIRGGFHYRHCPTRSDLVRFISVLFHWWTNKTLDAHRSHEAIYIAPPARVMMVEPRETCKMFSCLPGVGWDRAGKLDERFTFQVVDRATGEPVSPKELQTVDGIGKVVSAQITQTLWNNEEPHAQ